MSEQKQVERSFRDYNFSPVETLGRLIEGATRARDVAIQVALAGVYAAYEEGEYQTFCAINRGLALRWGFRSSERSEVPDEAFIEIRERAEKPVDGIRKIALSSTPHMPHGGWVVRAGSADDIPWLERVLHIHTGKDHHGFWVSMSDDSARLAVEEIIDQFQAANR